MQFSLATLGLLLPFLVQGSPIAENEPRACRATQFAVRSTATCSGGATIINAACAPQKGNFSPAQQSIVITTAAGNCHVSLYSGLNQAGATQRLNTDTTGTCITNTSGWLSYGYYCD